MAKKLAKSVYLGLLRMLAKLEMVKHKNATIIGITGSSGKTSCKEAVVAFLTPHVKNALKYTVKGNSETGIPYEILDIPVRHYKIWEYPFVLLRGLLHVLLTYKQFSIFVIEYGIDGPDAPLNMDYLLGIVKPHIGILLSISSVHGETFENDLDESIPHAKRVRAIETAIAHEKFKLLSAIQDRKKAYLTKQVTDFLSPSEYEGMTILDDIAIPSVTSIENTAEGAIVTLRMSKQEISALLPEIALTQSSRRNIQFAAVVTSHLKKDIATSFSQLPKNYHMGPGRSTLLPGNEGTLIIDSSYNANPFAAKELFPLVKELAKQGKRKKIIVLGDFRELGVNTPTIYAEVIKEAVKYADILVFTNNMMKEYGISVAEQAGLVLNENIYWFENGKQLSFHINEVIEKNAVVLFEGSQNTVFLEYAVKELCSNKDPEYIKTHIARMSNDWLEIK